MIISAEYHDVSEYFNRRAAGIQLIASLPHGHMAPTSPTWRRLTCRESFGAHRIWPLFILAGITTYLALAPSSLRNLPLHGFSGSSGWAFEREWFDNKPRKVWKADMALVVFGG